MMKRVVSELAFLLSFLLIFTSVMPIGVQAATDEWAKYTYKYGRGISTPVSTSTGDLLIEDANMKGGHTVYTYDIVKLNKQGIVENKALENGVNQFIQYGGKTYIFFYNYTTQSLEIYDENFTLLDTEKLGLTGGKISINQLSNYVRYEGGSSSTGGKESKLYDIEKQQLVGEESLPASWVERDYDSNGNALINAYDDLGRIVKSITLTNLIEENH